MALSSVAITGNIADMLGTDFDTRRTKIWVSTNIESGTVIDTAGNAIRLGTGNVTLNDDGTFTASERIPGTGSNPDSWQTYIHVDYPDRNAARGRATRTFGPFTITAAADLADLVEEQEVPAEYLTTVTTLLDGYVTDAEAARDETQALRDGIVGDLGTTDSQTATLINSPGSLTETALSASTDASIKASTARAKTAAASNGTTDARSALASEDTSAVSFGAAIHLPKGTYRVASNLTIASPVSFAPGATIKPDSGVTVTLSAGVIAQRSQIFDHSAGGVIALKGADYYHPAWWGPVGTSDDSTTWTQMMASITASKVTHGFPGKDFGQRILAPAGMNRIFGVTLDHCDVVADKGVTEFYPAGTPTSGAMLTLGDYVSIQGGTFSVGATTQAVTLLKITGYRSQIQNVYCLPLATGSIGIEVGTGPSITAVLNDIRIESAAQKGTGIYLNSNDCQFTNIWIAECATGIDFQRGGLRVSNLHVWGCGAGMTGAPDGSYFNNIFIETCLGWGVDFPSVDRTVFTGYHIWGNGAGVAGTGGVRISKSGGASCRDNVLTGGVFDDNVGVGLFIDGAEGTEVTATRFGSRTVGGGGSPVCDTAVRVSATSTNTRLSIRGRHSDHITTVVDDLSGNATVNMGEITKTLAADVTATSSTSYTTVLSVPANAKETWLVEGLIVFDTSQAADYKVRLQASSLTGVSGYFSALTPTAASNTSTTAASMSPLNAVAVAASSGTGVAAGGLGVGTVQAMQFRGRVTATGGTGSPMLELQAGPLASDATTTTTRAGSWMRATRVG
jgi:hypothetical protein